MFKDQGLLIFRLKVWTLGIRGGGAGGSTTSIARLRTSKKTRNAADNLLALQNTHMAEPLGYL
jgi:hypothetical protein